MTNDHGHEATCGRCGKAFACAMRDGGPRCWCADYPHVLPVPTGQSPCYCPDCLKDMIAARGASGEPTNPGA